jgi:hypothetical protein
VGVLDHDAREHTANGAEPRRRDAVHRVLFFFFVLRLGVFVLFSAFGPVKKKTKRKKRKEKNEKKKTKTKKRKKERRKKEEKRSEAHKKKRAKHRKKKKKDDEDERAVEAELDHVVDFVRRFDRDVLYARDDTQAFVRPGVRSRTGNFDHVLDRDPRCAVGQTTHRAVRIVKQKIKNNNNKKPNKKQKNKNKK